MISTYQSTGGSFNKTIARLNRLKSDERMRAALQIIADDATQRTPIDTGQLRKSQYIRKVQNEGWVIGNEAPYSLHVHERLDVNHPIGEAKFIEKAVAAKMTEFLNELTKE